MRGLLSNDRRCGDCGSAAQNMKTEAGMREGTWLQRHGCLSRERGQAEALVQKPACWAWECCLCHGYPQTHSPATLSGGGKSGGLDDAHRDREGLPQQCVEREATEGQTVVEGHVDGAVKSQTSVALCVILGTGEAWL